MKKNIPAFFLIISKINIISVIIFWGAFGFYQNLQASKQNKYLLIQLGFLVCIVTVYAFIYLLGAKLVKRYFNLLYTSKPQKNVRVVFYIIEIIFFIAYTYLVYLMISTFRVSNFLPLNPLNAFRVIAFIAFFAAYISSLLRIIFTWPLFNMVNDQRFELVDAIGETIHPPLKTVWP